MIQGVRVLMDGRGAAASVAMVLAVLVAALPIGRASAGTIRHDRDAAAYEKLGRKFEPVGQVFGQDSYGAWAGSGTLIGGRWVLTAAHIAEGADELTFSIAGQDIAARRWYIHSQWRGALLGGGDLAIIELDTNVTRTMGIKKARLSSSKRELGERAVFVGYGRTGTGITGDTHSADGRLAGRNYLDAYGSWLGGGSRASNILLADFDKTKQPARENILGSNRRDSLEFLIAAGDSGGGVFLDTKKGYRLAGVHSFVFALNDGDPNSDYGDGSGHTRVSPYINWIRTVIDGKAVSTAFRPARDGGSTLSASAAMSLTRWNLSPVMLPIPEPASVALVGVATLVLLQRRR